MCHFVDDHALHFSGLAAWGGVHYKQRYSRHGIRLQFAHSFIVLISWDGMRVFFIHGRTDRQWKMQLYFLEKETVELSWVLILFLRAGRRRRPQ